MIKKEVFTTVGPKLLPPVAATVSPHPVSVVAVISEPVDFSVTKQH